MKNRRIEKKWVFRNADYLLVLNSLLRSQFFFKNHYPSRKVNSIYYDDINLSNIIQNLDGVSNRVKYRVRWYGSNSDNLKGQDPDYNASKIIDIFSGDKNEFSEAVCLNSAAALIVCNKINKFEEAYEFSKKHLESGKALTHLKKIQTF